MSGKLFFQAIAKLIMGIILVGILIFLPAGTFVYSNGWLFLIILFVPMFVTGCIMMIKNPELLKKRLNAKEKQKQQSKVIAYSGLMFVAGFVIAGLDHRFGWSKVTDVVVMISAFIFLGAYLLYGEVIRENEYLSRIIRVQKDQKVIDKGLYAVVRHPMYTSTLFLFLSIPIILGSWWSFLVFLSYPFIISERIRYEEEFLKKELDGYIEYTKKVKYKMIPYIW